MMNARGIWIVLAFIALAIAAGNANAAVAPSVESASRLMAPIAGPIKMRAGLDIKSKPMAVKLNRARMATLEAGERMQLDLPNGETHEVVFDRVDDYGGGIRSTVGYLKSHGKDFRVIMTSGPGGTYGSFRTPTSRLQMVPNGDHDLIYDLNEEYKHVPRVNLGMDYVRGEPHEHHDSDEAAVLTALGGKHPAERGVTLAEPTPQVTVDVMFVYTRGLAERLGVNLLTRFYQLLATANTAYLDSEVAIRVRLVNATMVDYPDTGSDLTALNAIRPTSGGDHTPFNNANVYNIRTAVGADLVALMRNGGSSSGSGIATLTTNTVNGNPESLYSVTTGCVEACDSVFVHELGHNMGNAHDRATAAAEQGGTPTPASGAFAYSFGNFGCVSGTLSCNPFTPGGCSFLPTCSTSNNNNFGTIMSYFDPEILKFSNPNITCTSPGGTSRPCGVADTIDNARSMNNMRFVIRDARATTITTPPGALQFSATTFSTAETGGMASITVSRVGGSAGAVSVNYATQDSTAKAGFDYQSTSGTLNWADGDTTNKTINVPIFDEGVTEGTESFNVVLSAPAGATGAFIGYPASTTVQLTENTPWPPGGVLPAGFSTPGSASGAWAVESTARCNTGRAPCVGSPQVLSATMTFQDYASADLVYAGNLGTGQISFAYRVSSLGASFANLQVLVDGSAVFDSAGGDTGWLNANIPITSGFHTVTWRFRNRVYFPCENASVPVPPPDCADRAWIDDVALPLPVTGSATMLTSGTNPSNFGSPVTFTATTSGAAGTPTGVMSFFDGSTGITSCQFVAMTSGSAQCTTSALPVGVRSVTARYHGNTTYDVSTSATVMQTVNVSTFQLDVTKNGTGSGTVTSNPPGINCGMDCTEPFSNGLVVTLTALPAMGSTFAGWSGSGCSGTGTCNVTMTAARMVSATFVASPPGAPTLSNATAGNMQATLIFAPPASDGGSPITGYSGQCQDVGAVGPTFTNLGLSSPIVVTGLTNGVGYNCVVRAINSVGAGPASNQLSVTPSVSPALGLTSATSRKTHGGTPRELTISLGVPVTGAVTVEPRNASSHLVVFKFNNTVVNPGAASLTNLSCTPAMPPSATTSFGVALNEVLVTLSGVPDNCRLRVALTNVNGSTSTELAMGFLVGDVTSSRSVSAADIAAVKAHSGQTVTSDALARFDVSVSGTIGPAAISQTKSRSGLVLP